MYPFRTALEFVSLVFSLDEAMLHSAVRIYNGQPHLHFTPVCPTGSRFFLLKQVKASRGMAKAQSGRTGILLELTSNLCPKSATLQSIDHFESAL